MLFPHFFSESRHQTPPTSHFILEFMKETTPQTLQQKDCNRKIAAERLHLGVCHKKTGAEKLQQRDCNRHPTLGADLWKRSANFRKVHEPLAPSLETHCNKLHHLDWITLQHTAIHCNTQQYNVYKNAASTAEQFVSPWLLRLFLFINAGQLSIYMYV